MSRAVKIILAINLLALTILVFAYPHLMVSPGKLIPDHTGFETDCFACHAPLRGSSSERCATCHKPADIGRLTSTGKPIVRNRPPVTFHQKLKQQDCMTCHSDHAGVARYLRKGRFAHALLEPGVLDQCGSCHKRPVDTLHDKFEGNCGQCHESTRWKPATFDHDKYFVLDSDHNERCVTCHERNDYKRYTCYGCHEHTPGNMRSKHQEEGVSHFENCVECHRSADEHDIRLPGGMQSERRHGGDDDD